jgi:hypothetical protein
MFSSFPTPFLSVDTLLYLVNRNNELQISKEIIPFGLKCALGSNFYPWFCVYFAKVLF